MDKLKGIIIIYDGECPVCTRYVQMVRLKQVHGEVRLVNARSENSELVDWVCSEGYLIDDGMVVLYGDRVYYGADAIAFISLVTTSSSILNKSISLMFRCKWLGKFIYPVLVLLRRMLLILLGRNKMGY